jgi:hypothetical protein
MRSLVSGEEYVRRWIEPGTQADSHWKVELAEQRFTGDITHPDTGEINEHYCIGGKIDGCVRVLEPCLWGKTEIQPGLYLVEHKTARNINEHYLARLWTDMQIILYSHYISDGLGEPLEGVLYNVVGKCPLTHREAETQQQFEQRKKETRLLAEKGELPTGARQRKAQGETLEAFEARKLELAMQKVDELRPFERETDDEYLARLRSSFANEAMFHREVIEIDPRATHDVLSEVWEQLDLMSEAGRRKVWNKNEDMCHAFFRWCDYWQLCSSFDDQRVLNDPSKYLMREPHDEQVEDDNATVPQAT